eukprot:CAMPEP_0206156576 /NCGR_PEP_ID=MMETSP1474-20131121/3098_1 /ASSEMBLY_ACC=CAM_ASM_001110 /TAXON_ID=97495 /ORGANISM="Imantonia sp., Strain RCC918" /LENGTH=122 /DNA_ID=CAMNT_0053555707 /DNA_START=516 /DNA_END=882 /DNA_ORIENTATION=+
MRVRLDLQVRLVVADDPLVAAYVILWCEVNERVHSAGTDASVQRVFLAILHMLAEVPHDFVSVFFVDSRERTAFSSGSSGFVGVLMPKLTGGVSARLAVRMDWKLNAQSLVLLDFAATWNMS